MTTSRLDWNAPVQFLAGGSALRLWPRVPAGMGWRLVPHVAVLLNSAVK